MLMGKKLAIILCFITITFATKGEGYRISVKWNGLKDTTIYLAHYFDTNIYVNDTLQLNHNGEGVFNGDSLLHQGLYMLYLNGNTYFDFLVGEKQKLTIETYNHQLVDSLIVKGSVESEYFLTYQKFIKKQTTLKNSLTRKAEKQRYL
jgi:hypothetical protein